MFLRRRAPGGTPRSSMKYLTGLGQSPAVPISTVYIDTARLWPNPIKYFTDKKCTSLSYILSSYPRILLHCIEILNNPSLRILVI